MSSFLIRKLDILFFIIDMKEKLKGVWYHVDEAKPNLYERVFRASNIDYLYTSDLMLVYIDNTQITVARMFSKDKEYTDAIWCLHNTREPIENVTEWCDNIPKRTPR